jgi:hypothetical protein
MKNFSSYIFLFTVLMLGSCHSQPLPKNGLVISFGKLHYTQEKPSQEKQIFFVSEDGEKLIPSNLKEFQISAIENAEFQLTYTELSDKTKDSLRSVTIRINEIKPAAASPQ